jgi:molybdate transport repressor ModE-like protein
VDSRLKIFCTVAETGSFTRAARIVHLSQPAVSLQIQSLEELYETKLFDKTEGKISLTPAGQILYEKAKGILEQFTEIEKEINRLTGMMKGAVNLGASTTLGNYILPYIITEFKKIHPKIKVKMLVGNTARVEDLLASGFINFGIVEGNVSKKNISAEKVMSDQLMLVAHPRHPLTRKKSVSIIDLTNEPFILREEGSGTRQKIEEFLKYHGVSVRALHIGLVLGSTESVKTAVETGSGIAMVSKWSVKKELEDGRLKIIRLKEGGISRTISLISSKNYRLSNADKEFILFAKNYPYESL